MLQFLLIALKNLQFSLLFAVDSQIKILYLLEDVLHQHY